MDLLRPPDQHRLDLAVLTTYTLDLEALLALPLAVLSQSDRSIDELMANPLDLIAALREAGDRIHVFVDATGIQVPDRGKELVSTLESSVHPDVEVLVRLAGRRYESGIEHFLGKFRDLCEPYEASLPDGNEEDIALAEERQRGKLMLEAAQGAVMQAVASGCLRIVCVRDGDVWEWRMEGEITDMRDGVIGKIWPASISEEQSHPLDQRSWRLPASALTAFAAFRMSVAVDGVDDLRWAMMLQATGLPNDRTARILRSLIDSPGKFLRFLRALLGGLEGQKVLLPQSGEGRGSVVWEAVFGGETLLEDLLRTASRDPGRLDIVRRLITDLRRTEDGGRIIEPALYKLWQAIDRTVTTR